MSSPLPSPASTAFASPLALADTAREAAEAAAEVHRRHAGRLGTDGGVEKGHRDFVSQVDMEAQEAALAVIRRRHPHHRIMAEEEDGESEGEGSEQAGEPGEGDGGTAEVPLWIVDPLDGTTNYLHGHPLHCASVGVLVGGGVLAGAVTASATGERWWAAREAGAFRNGEPIRVSTLDTLPRALVGTGFPFKTPDRIPEHMAQLARVLRRTSGVRRLGSAALDLCYLAQGSLDGFWELTLSPWDVAGGLAVLAEAGGVALRLDGTPLALTRPGSVLAANGPVLLEALGRVVRGEEEGG